MVGTSEYRGIQYSVEQAGELCWRWRVSPLLCVRGMREEAGEIARSRDEAMQAAHAAIKGQGLANGDQA